MKAERSNISSKTVGNIIEYYCIKITFTLGKGSCLNLQNCWLNLENNQSQLGPASRIVFIGPYCRMFCTHSVFQLISCTILVYANVQ